MRIARTATTFCSGTTTDITIIGEHPLALGRDRV
jgi:hypothetical protein